MSRLPLNSTPMARELATCLRSLCPREESKVTWVSSHLTAGTATYKQASIVRVSINMEGKNRCSSICKHGWNAHSGRTFGILS